MPNSTWLGKDTTFWDKGKRSAISCSIQEITNMQILDRNMKYKLDFTMVQEVPCTIAP